MGSNMIRKQLCSFVLILNPLSSLERLLMVVLTHFPDFAITLEGDTITSLTHPQEH